MIGRTRILTILIAVLTSFSRLAVGAQQASALGGPGRDRMTG